MEFDLAGYNENKCKEHDVSVTEQTEPTEDINQQFQPQNRLMLFRCPPILTRYRSTRNFFYTYYVSSNLQNESLTLFVRENQKGKLPRLEANIYELQMEPIVKDIRRQRFLPGPPKIVSQSRRSPKFYREIEDEVNSLEGEIAMPPSVMQYSNILEIQYLEAKIDETVIQKIYSDKWIPDHIAVCGEVWPKLKIHRAEKEGDMNGNERVSKTVQNLEKVIKVILFEMRKSYYTYSGCKDRRMEVNKKTQINIHIQGGAKASIPKCTSDSMTLNFKVGDTDSAPS
ncbi:hypothetical protein ACFE04_016246 [Oxalis oulophora]